MPITTAKIARAGLSPSVIQGAFNPNPWGRTVYVQSTHIRASNSGNTGLQATRPLATLAQAVSQSQVGDMIIVGPNHVETLLTSLSLTKGNLRIVGVGVRANRPVITVAGAVGTTITVGTTGNHFENLDFRVGIASLTSMFTISGSGTEFVGCMFSQNALAATTFITGTSTSGPTLIECRVTANTAGGDSFMTVAAGSNLLVQDCFIIGNFVTGAIIATALQTNLLIERNKITQQHATGDGIVLFANCTGTIADNRFRSGTDAALDAITTAGNTSLFENYIVNNNGETGILFGTPSV